MQSETEQDAETPLYGISLEFDSGEALLQTALHLRPYQFGRLNAYSPVPIRGLSAALGDAGSMGPVALTGALIGFTAILAMCIYATAFDYVFEIGGKPRFNWTSFIVPSVSFGMLAGSVALYGVMLFMNRLPRLNHPAFNIPHFTRASQDRYFLIIEKRDERLELEDVMQALRGLDRKPLNVAEVPR